MPTALELGPEKWKSYAEVTYHENPRFESAILRMFDSASSHYVSILALYMS